MRCEWEGGGGCGVNGKGGEAADAHRVDERRKQKGLAAGAESAGTGATAVGVGRLLVSLKYGRMRD
eukprot:scaffold12517_cov101-Isochrysis_galbana.AAC.2